MRKKPIAYKTLVGKEIKSSEDYDHIVDFDNSKTKEFLQTIINTELKNIESAGESSLV